MRGFGSCLTAKSPFATWFSNLLPHHLIHLLTQLQCPEVLLLYQQGPILSHGSYGCFERHPQLQGS